MPVIWPATSERNFTPTSTALRSDSATVPGVVVLLQMEHGQVAAAARLAFTNPPGKKLAVRATSRPTRTIGRTAGGRRRRGERRTAAITATPRVLGTPGPWAGVR